MCWVKLANVARAASPRVVLDLLKESDSDAKNGPKGREFGGLALLQAAEHNGDVNVLKALMQHGVEIDVNCRDTWLLPKVRGISWSFSSRGMIWM